MYNTINKKFKQDSHHRNNIIFFILIPILLFTSVTILSISLSVFFPNKNFIKWIIIALIASAFVFCLLNCYLIAFFSIKNEPEFSIKKHYHIKPMIELYKTVMCKKDIENLKKILKEEGVNTRPKVLEVLHHYQSLLPRKMSGGSQIISILALSISALAFVFSDKIFNCFKYQIISLLCILGVLLIYILCHALNKKVFYFLGEAALNTRIEMAVSEIWMKSLIK